MGVPSLWTRMCEVVEDYRSLRRRHRADGVVTEEEDRIEEAFVARMEAVAADYAESAAIGRAVAHGGFEGYRAQALIRERCVRHGHQLRIVVRNDWSPRDAA